MSNVKIDKASSYLKYENNNTSWTADIITNVYDKEIILLGTTRVLTNNERDDIITEILNKYAFGNYLNKEDGIWKCKLKNRGLEKYEEIKQNDMRSYSILTEEIVDYSKRQDDCDMLKVLRTLYLNLKIEVTENIKIKKIPQKTRLEFTFNGKKSEYKLFLDIISYIKEEFEDALSRYAKKNVYIKIIKGKLNDKKANTLFIIKGA